MSCAFGTFIAPSATPRYASSASARAASAAMNSSYARTPTACDRLSDVGPVPPVYLSDSRHKVPWPAVGIATHACACASSSFVKPVRSFPNKTATLPRRASSTSIRAAVRAVTNGTFPRGRAVVAMTNVQSARASMCVSCLDASARSQSAAHAKRYASAQSGGGGIGGVSRAFSAIRDSPRSPRSSFVSVGRRASGMSSPSPSPSGPSAAPEFTPPRAFAPSGAAEPETPSAENAVASESPARSSTNGPGLTSRRSYTPKFCMTRATAPQFWGPCGAQSTKHTSPSAACESKTSSFQGGATRRGEDGAVSEEAPREPRARRCLLAPPPPPGNDVGRAETPRVPVDASARVVPRRGATRARANSELVNRSAMSPTPDADTKCRRDR